MSRFVQQDLGRCDFIDVLEESVLMNARVKVERADGTSFEDHVRDVVTSGGHEEVHFQNHEPLRVREIAAVEREPLAHTYRRDPRREPAAR